MTLITGTTLGDAVANAINGLNPMSPGNLAILKSYWEPIAQALMATGAGGFTSYNIVTVNCQHGVQASVAHGMPSAPTLAIPLGCDGGLSVRGTPILADLGSGNVGVTVRYDNQDEVFTDWATYTPSVSAWSAATAVPTGKWRRIGDTMECMVKLALNGAPTGSLTDIGIANSQTIDTTKLVSTAVNRQSFGMGTMVCAGVADYLLNAAYHSTTTIRPVSYTITGYPNNGVASTGVGDVGISAAVPGTFASGDELQLKFAVPIVGWTAFPGHTANVTIMLLKQ